MLLRVADSAPILQFAIRMERTIADRRPGGPGEGGRPVKTSSARPQPRSSSHPGIPEDRPLFTAADASRFGTGCVSYTCRAGPRVGEIGRLSVCREMIALNVKDHITDDRGRASTRTPTATGSACLTKRHSRRRNLISTFPAASSTQRIRGVVHHGANPLLRRVYRRTGNRIMRNSGQLRKRVLPRVPVTCWVDIIDPHTTFSYRPRLRRDLSANMSTTVGGIPARVARCHDRRDGAARFIYIYVIPSHAASFRAGDVLAVPLPAYTALPVRRDRRRRHGRNPQR